MTRARTSSFAWLAAAALLALPSLASAQGTITAHKLSMSFKAVSQTTNNSGDYKPDKFTAIECGDEEDSPIFAIDTDPYVALTGQIGEAHVELGQAVWT